MTILDADSVAAVRESVREVFSSHTTGAAGAVEAALADLGWSDVMAADPVTATRLLFVEQGRAVADTRLLERIVLDTLTTALPTDSAPADLLAGVSGVLLPRPRTGCVLSTPPRAEGLLLGAPTRSETILVPYTDDGGTRIVVVDASSLDIEDDCAGFDSQTSWLLATTKLEPGSGEGVGAAWDLSVAAAHRALSAELVGLCSAALDLAVAHVTSRRQYGRPLGSFQSVRHQLSEAHAAIESTASLLSGVEGLLSGDTSEITWASSLLKHRAGVTQSLVLRRTIQVMGAMGLTHETSMHRFVTRAASLDLLLGDHHHISASIGSAGLGGAPLPRVVSI